MKRILCIDGGGIKGTQPAAFLAHLEESLDEPIGRYFDLIAGTSTGGILAIGLALGLRAKELLDLYEHRGPAIFGESEDLGWLGRKGRSARAILRQAVKPKHDAAVLEKELKKILGDRRIGEAQTRLLVPAWDADQRSVYIYKTAHHSRLSTDYRRPALDAAMATSAAPTYFERHKTVDDVGLLDGGVWANNPIAIATVEAISMLGWDPAELQILSLGCVDEVYLLPEAPGTLGLGMKAMSLFMDGQSRGALGMAKLMTGDPHDRQAIYRYSPSVPTGFFSLDDTSKIKRLKGLGASGARHASPTLSKVFFQKPAEPFQPVYSLEREIA
ncbi:MAG: CBASS cGAMP-activated phospholipase [Rhizobiaceae bacterium]